VPKKLRENRRLLRPTFCALGTGKIVPMEAKTVAKGCKGKNPKPKNMVGSEGRDLENAPLMKRWSSGSYEGPW